MAKIARQAGTTGQIVEVFVLDTTSTTGAGKTGLTNSNFTCYYKRNLGTGSVAVTLDASSGVTLGTYEPTVASHGAIKEVDSTNMAGLYEFHIPNNALASGADEVALMLTGTGIRVNPIEIELTATNNQDGTRGGMTALPNANANANGGLPILSVSGTTLGYTVTTVTTVTNQLTAAAIATGVWQDTTSGDFTVASSIGKSLYTSGAAPGAASGLLIAGSNAATTFATLTSTGAFSINGTSDVAQTGDSFARLGAPAGASIAADLAEIEAETDGIAAIPTSNPSAASIATAVWQDTTAGDFTTAGSIGKSLGGAFTALGNSVFTVAALANAPSGGGGGGNVTVGGYASGQDPATLVLDVLASGHNTANSIGADINAIPGLASQLTAIQAKLGAASVTVSSPVARSGAVSLIRGDSYYQADGRSLSFADSGGTWPNLTGASVTLSFVAGGSVLLAAAAVVDVAGGSSQAVHADLSAVQTAALPNACGCQLTAVLSSGHTVTLSRGSVTVSGPG